MATAQGSLGLAASGLVATAACLLYNMPAMYEIKIYTYFLTH
jgi:hypothetical protein